MGTEPIIKVLVRAPAFGVRVFQPSGLGQGPIVLQWLDEGGHGYPWETLLIRVDVDGNSGRVRWLLADGSTVWDAADKRVLQPAGTGSFRIQIDDWPGTGSHVLLLSAHVLVAHDSTRGQQRPYSDAELIAAVRLCLSKGGGANAIRLPERPPEVGPIKAAPAQPAQPAQAASSLNFALASCHYPHDIFDRMPDAPASLPGPADASLLQLAEVLDTTDGDEKPSLIILAGDQVYLDATAGLFDPRVLTDRVRRPYELFFGSQGAQRVFGRADVQTYMLFDDHEFSDNYETCDAVDKALRRQAKAGYWEFQRGEARRLRLWRTLSHQGFEFFLGDTRMGRTPRSVATLARAHIMNRHQRAALGVWLQQHKGCGRPLFIATSSMVLPRRLLTAHEPHAALMSDAWDGYPASLHCLLGTLCHHEIHNVVLLSGDEHLSCHARITLRDTNGHQVVVHSVHSSALYAPYPFANGVAALLADEETFQFDAPAVAAGVRFSCQVHTEFAPPGDGFTTLKVTQDNGDWWLRLRYHGATGVKTGGEPAPLRLAHPAPSSSAQA